MGQQQASDAHPLALVTPDGRLSVQFDWVEDRFVQQILRDGHVVARSIDGDPQQAWPPSPPLQQLSREVIGERAVVLGVGAAGRSHWSISVEVIESAGIAALKFDLACRCKDDPRPLGSHSPLGSRYTAEASLLWTAGDGTQLQQSDAEVIFRPADAGSGPTWRWSYRVQLSDLSK